jgi:ferritin-like metal-binding protein YciE
MDASPDVLADHIRAKRTAIDNDLELIRVRLQRADPRRIDPRRLAQAMVPIAAGSALAVVFSRWRRPIRSLDHLLTTGLGEVFAAEQHLVPALASMAGRATNPDLRQALEQHRQETESHVDRLRRVFRSVGAKRQRSRTAAGVPMIIAEGERLLKGVRDPDVLDAALIATAQRIEHVEIAIYGTLRTYSETLGYTHAAQLLQQTLEEERAADVTLTRIAERFVNPQSLRTERPA